ncbi:MAG: hypothetical protein ABSG28_11325 [Methanoregula sp.]|jgi:hypothetical protein|uniref:hypothetical protein n=1 Tax=Methanoregula sp. TaxID=2052170 RepID=UPI003C234DAA
MNTNARYAVLALIVTGILLILAHAVSTPLLYSLENDIFSTPFHDNVEVLKLQSLNSTTDILPQLQDIIDFPGPISLNIQIHDAADAQRALDLFTKNQVSLKNLIVTLDMNQSEIQELETDTGQQKEILDTLLNTSVTLDSLQTLEIQYRDENNNDMLTTVRLQGDAVRKRVQGLDERYRNSTEKITGIATKFGLDPTKNQESQKAVDQITREIEQPESTARIPVTTSLIPGEERISLFIRPETGVYRDIIECMGLSLTLEGNTTLRAQGQPILLYVDDNPVSNVTTDTFGYYDVKFPIGRILAGNHTVYARSPTSRSVDRTLTVIPLDSVTNLTLSKPDPEGNVNCTGFVMANYPVASASVQITWDQSHVIVTKTNANGKFMQKIQLSPGVHTMIADFYGDGYPLNPSESDPVVVDISFIRGVDMDYGRIALIISGIGLFLLFLGAAVLYLRRMGQRKIPSSGASRDTEFSAETGSELLLTGPVGSQQNPVDDSMKAGKETLITYYTRILREQGLSAASRSVYQLLAGRIAHDLHIRRHKTLTAREMSRNCRGKPYCGAFARFVSVYERVRYGGQVSVKDQAVFETAIDSTEEQMGGEDH